MVSLLLKIIPCSCFISLFAISTANAAPEQKNVSQKNLYLFVIPATTLKLESLAESNAQKNLLTSLDINKEVVPVVIDFNKMKPQNSFKQIKEQYLTYRTGKNEKLNLAYTDGAYGFSYTQNW